MKDGAGRSGATALRALAVAGGTAVGALLADIRVQPARQPLTDRWRMVPVAPRGTTSIGLTFRPRQAEAFGLDPEPCLHELLKYHFPLIRLGVYWNRVEPEPGTLKTDEIDAQVDAARRAGKRIILGVGAVKMFGYPEFFVPPHHLPRPLPEGSLVTPETHPSLLAAATGFVTRIVERYRDCEAITAWQVEHEAVDPLGMEHSWRLSESFAAAEVATVRRADPGRPVVMNGFVATSATAGITQWWRTRGQGDSLVVAQRLADVVGIDYYPRLGLLALGSRAIYADGSTTPWAERRSRRLLSWAAREGRQVMISEGQAEPWETITTPPNPPAGEGNPEVMSSCRPEHVIENYNRCMRWSRTAARHLSAYLFWGAEYWLLRAAQGDSGYLGAFERVLDLA